VSNILMIRQAQLEVVVGDLSRDLILSLSKDEVRRGALG